VTKFDAVYQHNDQYANVVIEIRCVRCKEWSKVLVPHNLNYVPWCLHCRDIGREYKERKT
jgi:hypothetical protein